MAAAYLLSVFLFSPRKVSAQSQDLSVPPPHNSCGEALLFSYPLYNFPTVSGLLSAAECSYPPQKLSHMQQEKQFLPYPHTLREVQSVRKSLYICLLLMMINRIPVLLFPGFPTSVQVEQKLHPPLNHEETSILLSLLRDHFFYPVTSMPHNAVPGNTLFRNDSYL